MPRLLPLSQVLQKTAQLYAADTVGRDYADDLVVNRMAKLAGALMAGQISQMDYEELLKEAGLFSSVGKLLSRKAPKLRASVGKLFKRTQKPMSSAGPVLRRRSGRVTPIKKPAVPAPVPKPASQARGPAAKAPAGQPLGPVQAGPKGVTVPGRVVPAQGGGHPYRQPAATPTSTRPGPVVQEVGRSPGARRVGAAPVSGAAPGAGAPARALTPGQVQQRAQEAAEGALKSVPTAAADTGTAGTRSGTAAPAPAPAGGGGIAGAAWRNRKWLALAGAGAGLYGVGKGAQFAARQLEQTSTTPQSHGTPGGWSPVNYGYGDNPYGNQPSMGYGG